MSLNPSPSRAPPERRDPKAEYHHIVQGEQRVTSNENAVLATLLGSCVSACMRDPSAGVGGMNHFLLPGDFDKQDRDTGERLGVHAMELLINDLLRNGASRKRLEAKVFGGACLNMALPDIGRANASFALKFLQREGISIVGQCLGGNVGRRLQYWPTTGRARRSFLSASDPTLEAAPPARVAAPVTGALELF